MKILIKGGRVIDPASGFDEEADIALMDGAVLAINNIASEFTPDRVLDATGCIVAPILTTANGASVPSATLRMNRP